MSLSDCRLDEGFIDDNGIYYPEKKVKEFIKLVMNEIELASEPHLKQDLYYRIRNHAGDKLI